MVDELPEKGHELVESTVVELVIKLVAKCVGHCTCGREVCTIGCDGAVEALEGVLSATGRGPEPEGSVCAHAIGSTKLAAAESALTAFGFGTVGVDDLELETTIATGTARTEALAGDEGEEGRHEDDDGGGNHCERGGFCGALRVGVEDALEGGGVVVR